MTDVVASAAERMAKCVEHLNRELRGFRTGRADPSLVEGVPVECYGTALPLGQIAAVGVPEPQLIVVRPHDPEVVGAALRALQAANLGINPVCDGRLIRLPVPRPSGDLRRSLARLASKRAEAARVAVRNVRRSAQRELEGLAKLMPDARSERLRRQVDELTASHVSAIDSNLARKLAELESP